jgi:glycolate oxidase iron-sulfur subunit
VEESRALRLSSLLARLPGRFGFAMAMLEATRAPVERAAYRPRGDGSRGSATLLTGCVMEGLFTETNRATERTLAANDYDIVHTSGQRCCGALHAHAGDADAARALARHNIAAFEASGADHVVANAAGCGAMMKEYEHLFTDEPEWRHRAAALSSRVRDVSEVLAEAGPPPGGALDVTVTYDASSRSTGCTTRTRLPAWSKPAPICIRQPGFPVATSAARVSAMHASFGASTASLTSGSTRL